MKTKLKQVAQIVITQARHAKNVGVKTGVKIITGAQTVGVKTTKFAGNLAVGTAISEGFDYALSHEQTAAAKAAIKEQIPAEIITAVEAAHTEFHESAQKASAAIMENAPAATRVVAEATTARIVTGMATQGLNKLLMNGTIALAGSIITAAACAAVYLKAKEPEEVAHNAAAKIAAGLASDKIGDAFETKAALVVGRKAGLVVGAVSSHFVGKATEEAYDYGKAAITATA